MNARDHFLMLARYNVWATDRLLERHVARLSDDEYKRDVGLFTAALTALGHEGPELDLLFPVLADGARKS